MRAGYALDVSQWTACQAIFALDVRQVLLECDGTVVNLNSRVPDEGAVVEGTIAWTAGKPVVLFKDGARSKIDGLDNPLVAGLGGFRLVSRSEDWAGELARAFTEHPPAKLQVGALPATTRQAIERGQCLSDGCGAGDSRRLVQTIIELFPPR